MTVDLSLKPEWNYAKYIPAISSSYTNWGSKWKEKMEQVDKDGNLKFPNRHPKALSPNADELYFLNDNNGAFHYNLGLYSAGHAEINDINLSKTNEKIVHSRDRNKTTLLADSGGFQIATGASGSSVSGFDWSNISSKENDELRLKLLRWMEATADYSMMLDVPTHAIGNPKNKIRNFQDCISYTKYNADFFTKNRIPGATKILNVLQGRNKEECDLWWDTFKDYEFEGWAIGGVSVRNMELLLRRIITMRDGNYLNENKKWMHVLGTSKLSSACILTEIQRSIRKTVQKDFSVSFDSATPFVVAAKGMVFTKNIFEGNKKHPKFSYRTEKMLEDIACFKSEMPFPFESIPAKYLTIGDICCRDPKVSGTKTTWDSYSYLLIMWHNLYRQIPAIQEALRLYDIPVKSYARQYVPEDVMEFKELCPQIFQSEKPYELIEENKKLLHRLTGRNNETHISILDSKSNLFSWDNNVTLNSDAEEILENSDGREIVDFIEE